MIFLTCKVKLFETKICCCFWSNLAKNSTYVVITFMGGTQNIATRYLFENWLVMKNMDDKWNLFFFLQELEDDGDIAIFAMPQSSIKNYTIKYSWFFKVILSLLRLLQISSYTFDCFLKKRGKKLINADFYIGGNYPKICTFRHEKKLQITLLHIFHGWNFFSISNIGIFHTFLLNESRCSVLFSKNVT